MKPFLPLALLASTAALLVTTPTLAEDLTATYDSGQGLSFAITYDTSVPNTRTTDPVDGTDEISGGINFGTAPVITSAVLTDDGTTLSFTPDYHGDVYTSSTYADFDGYDLAGDEFQINILFNGQGSTNLDTPFTGLQGVGNEQGGEVFGYFATAEGEPINFDVAVAAPEPMTWALMVSGLAIIGGALRWSRPRRLALTAAA